jgi:hypothetical protein
MSRLLIAVVSLLLYAAPAVAQTNPIPASQPFTVGFDHDGQNVTGFQCVLDGKPLGSVLPVTSRVCAIPGQPQGTHSIVVEGINAFGRTGSSALTATAGVPPSAPTNLRIQMTVAVKADGTAELLAMHVEKLP